jgi:hypothetical protein
MVNPTALCALLGLFCAAPKAHARHEVMGMVAGHAREVLAADWAAHQSNVAPERAWLITKDSVDLWPVGPTDTRIVLYVLEVEPVAPQRATPMSFLPVNVPRGPMLHTHQNYCTTSPWGIDYGSCSGDVPESHQCLPSFADQRTQIAEGHPYDAIMCGPQQYVFYFPPDR